MERWPYLIYSKMLAGYLFMYVFVWYFDQLSFVLDFFLVQVQFLLQSFHIIYSHTVYYTVCEFTCMPGLVR